MPAPTPDNAPPTMPRIPCVSAASLVLSAASVNSLTRIAIFVLAESRREAYVSLFISHISVIRAVNAETACCAPRQSVPPAGEDRGICPALSTAYDFSGISALPAPCVCGPLTVETGDSRDDAREFVCTEIIGAPMLKQPRRHSVLSCSARAYPPCCSQYSHNFS